MVHEDYTDIQAVKDFFTSKNMRVERIYEKENRSKEKPDLRIEWKKDALLYCEVKNVQDIFNQEVGLYLHNTRFNKLSSVIHKSSKQFNSFNLNHLIPNVIVFVSRDMQLHWKVLYDVLCGEIKTNETIICSFKNKDAFRRLKEDLTNIDYIIWLQYAKIPTYILINKNQFTAEFESILKTTKNPVN